jgi:hypothetical protein
VTNETFKHPAAISFRVTSADMDEVNSSLNLLAADKSKICSALAIRNFFDCAVAEAAVQKEYVRVHF